MHRLPPAFASAHANGDDSPMEARISIITLGVHDLAASTAFYRDGLGFPLAQNSNEHISFFKTGGPVLALYPHASLAADATLNGEDRRGTFPGFTLAHNTRSKQEVDEVLEHARQAGARIVKPAEEVFWGGYSGYFSDPDDFLWEVAFAPNATFDEAGGLVFE